MATKFTVGNYYKNETKNRELVILITSRTKCFVNYKKYWISDLANDEHCTEGKIKIRIDEEGGEYILLDGYDKYKSSNNYEYVEVKEVKEANKITFDEVKTFALSSGYTLITEQEYAQNSGYDLITERKNENNFRLCSNSGKGQFIKLNDVVGTIREGTLLNKEYSPLPFSMTEDEVRQLVLSAGYNFFSWHGGYILNEKYYYTLADVIDTVKDGRLLTGDSCAIAITEEEAFIEAKEYALSCGYILTKLSNNEYCNFSLCSISNRIGQFTKLEGVTKIIKEGRLLTGEACAWPINSNSLNNSHTHNSQGAIVANLKIKNKEVIDESRKINLKIDGKMVAINLDIHHEIKLIHSPVFGWQLVGVDSQELREPLNVEDKTQPTLKFKTRESASRFAIKLMAKIKNNA